MQPGMKEPVDETSIAAADNVRRLRKLAKISQQELADASGLHKNTIYSFEKHRQTIELGTLTRIAVALSDALRKEGGGPVGVMDLLKTSHGKVRTDHLIDEYRKSPWAQIDKPTEPELGAIGSNEFTSWLGAEPGPEAIHYLLLALRNSGK